MQAATDEAGYSRLIAGIHYRMDKTSGEKLGRDVASEAVKYAASLKVPMNYTSSVAVIKWL